MTIFIFGKENKIDLNAEILFLSRPKGGRGRGSKQFLVITYFDHFDIKLTVFISFTSGFFILPFLPCHQPWFTWSLFGYFPIPNSTLPQLPPLFLLLFLSISNDDFIVWLLLRFTGDCIFIRFHLIHLLETHFQLRFSSRFYFCAHFFHICFTLLFETRNHRHPVERRENETRRQLVSTLVT